MGFENLNTDAGVATLNGFISERSYIEDYHATQADVAVWEAVAKAPDANKYPHAARWYRHIAALKGSFAQYNFLLVVLVNILVLDLAVRRRRPVLMALQVLW